MPKATLLLWDQGMGMGLCLAKVAGGFGAVEYGRWGWWGDGKFGQGRGHKTGMQGSFYRLCILVFIGHLDHIHGFWMYIPFHGDFFVFQILQAHMEFL